MGHSRKEEIERGEEAETPSIMGKSGIKGVSWVWMFCPLMTWVTLDKNDRCSGVERTNLSVLHTLSSWIQIDIFMVKVAVREVYSPEVT